jgi:hypothetical protein
MLLMTRRMIAVMLILVAVMASACEAVSQPTGDSKSDAQSASNYLPVLANVQTIQADSIQTALSSAAGGASLLSGNLIAAALVSRMDAMIACYRAVGAVDARVYVSVTPPAVGAVAVVNTTRAANNFTQCLLNPGARAESAGPTPCASTGTFVDLDNNFAYFYAATDTALCTQFETHFSRYSAQ